MVIMVIMVRMLRYISQNPEVQATLRHEINLHLAGEELRLEKVSKMQYLTACFYETLRLTSSAIVPHMTNRDTSVDGKKINII